MERPILFSAPMVRAILDGHKTMTRRVVKPAWIPIIEESARVNGHPALECLAGDIVQPYGSIGDRLWVRETFWQAASTSVNENGECYGNWCHEVKYHEDSTAPKLGNTWGKRPSIFMPRWASRITLEVTAVRVERLQEISDADARSEGVDWSSPEPYGEKWDWEDREDPAEVGYPSSGASFARDNFRRLWDSINRKKCPWDDNPWVWVIEFQRLAN